MHHRDGWEFVTRRAGWMIEADGECFPVRLDQLARKFEELLHKQRVYLIAPNGVRLHPSVWHLLEGALH